MYKLDDVICRHPKSVTEYWSSVRLNNKIKLRSRGGHTSAWWSCEKSIHPGGWIFVPDLKDAQMLENIVKRHVKESRKIFIDPYP